MTEIYSFDYLVPSKLRNGGVEEVSLAASENPKAVFESDVIPHPETEEQATPLPGGEGVGVQADLGLNTNSKIIRCFDFPKI